MTPCILTCWLSFLFGIGAGVVLLAIILAMVDKAMRR